MAYNRQQMAGEVNPLFKKFVKEGGTPTAYIPADKRREIYDYMGKTNYIKNMSKHHNHKLLAVLSVAKALALHNALNDSLLNQVLIFYRPYEVKSD